MENRCVHGLDLRFCSICIKRCNPPESAEPARPISDADLADVIAFLNDQRVRATYGAVAEVVGGIARGIGARLGPRRIEASWIVNADTGLPTDYEIHQRHPALMRSEIIESGASLERRLMAWRENRRAL